jgi:hypothetical protein
MDGLTNGVEVDLVWRMGNGQFGTIVLGQFFRRCWLAVGNE